MLLKVTWLFWYSKPATSKDRSHWKLCTYLVFKDHALHSLQNTDINRLKLLCQQLFLTTCFFTLTRNPLARCSASSCSLQRGAQSTMRYFQCQDFFCFCLLFPAAARLVYNFEVLPEVFTAKRGRNLTQAITTVNTFFLHRLIFHFPAQKYNLSFPCLCQYGLRPRICERLTLFLYFFGHTFTKRFLPTRMM